MGGLPGASGPTSPLSSSSREGLGDAPTETAVSAGRDSRPGRRGASDLRPARSESARGSGSPARLRLPRGHSGTGSSRG